MTCVVCSDEEDSEAAFVLFFLAPLPWPLPLPLAVPEELAPVALPIISNRLIGGAISETWPTGMNSGSSRRFEVSVGTAKTGTGVSTQTSWDLGTVGPSRKDLIWGLYLKSRGAERGSPL